MRTEEEIRHEIGVINTQLKPLFADRDTIAGKIKERVGNREKLELELLNLKSPIKIGDLIEWPSRKFAYRGKVTFIEGFFGDRFTYYAARQRKDGSFGESIRVWVLRASDIKKIPA